MTDGYTQRQGRTCTTPGCTRTTVPPQPKCSMHAALAARQHNERNAYYHSQHWARLRESCIARDGRQCVVCAGTHRLTAHHIVARVNGGMDSLHNLTTLCQPCHSRVEQDDVDTGVALRQHLRTVGQ